MHPKPGNIRDTFMFSCLTLSPVCVRQGLVLCELEPLFPAVIHVYAECKIVSRVSQIAAKHCSALEITVL